MIKNQIDYDKLSDVDSPERRTRSARIKKSTQEVKNSKRARNFLGGKFTELVRNKSLVNKILFTLFIVFIYRLLASVPLPGLDMTVYEQYFGQSTASEISYLFLIFTGGSLDTPSIVGIGIIAYINASIIMQLLTPVIPKLHSLSKDGAQGQQVINQYTRYLSVPLSFVYSFVYLLIVSQNDLAAGGSGGETANPAYLVPHEAGSNWPSISKLLFMALVLTAGAMLLMWLAESINERGIGNGSSVIISVGIIASLPTLISQDFSLLNIPATITEVFAGNFTSLLDPALLSLLGVIIGGIIFLALVIFISEATRKIKIQYARRSVLTDAAEDTSLPIKLTITGVLPMIFASSILAVPQLIIPLLQNTIDPASRVGQWITSIQSSFLFASVDSNVDSNDLTYSVVYFLLIVVFSVFYSFIVLKPKDTAENLQKNSAFIPGVRPGKSTENYISKTLIRMAFAGGIFLGFVALAPLLARNLILSSTGINMAVLSGIGGTSILIIASVFLDTFRQFKALMVSRKYDSFK